MTDRGKITVDEEDQNYINGETVEKLRTDLSKCQRIGLRHLDIVRHLKENVRTLNSALSAQTIVASAQAEALEAQATHIEDLEQELDLQLSELRTLCDRIEDSKHERGTTLHSMQLATQQVQEQQKTNFPQGNNPNGNSNREQ